jgi:5-oxoprolinase (ATP-hydrolysing)
MSARKQKQGLTTFVPQDSKTSQKVYVAGQWVDASVHRLNELPVGSMIDGTALIIDDTQTILIDPEFQAFILPNHVILERKEGVQENSTARAKQSSSLSCLSLLIASCPSPSRWAIRFNAHQYLQVLRRD